MTESGNRKQRRMEARKAVQRRTEKKIDRQRQDRIEFQREVQDIKRDRAKRVSKLTGDRSYFLPILNLDSDFKDWLCWGMVVVVVISVVCNLMLRYAGFRQKGPWGETTPGVAISLRNVTMFS